MEYLNKRKFAIFLMLFPTLLFYSVYVIAPVFVSFSYSMTNWKGFSGYKFVGLKNYITMWSDQYFLISLKNTFIMVIFVIVIMLPCSLFMALMLNRKLKGKIIFTTLNFMPVVIAPIISGIMWTFILDPTNGILNSFLNQIGLGFLALQWIGGLKLSPYSISVVGIWQGMGLMMLILLAGLKMIPEEIYQAGLIDGTNRFQKLIHITLPMIRESILICAILIVSGTFKIFETVLMLTGGGPNSVSQTIATYMYQVTFRDWQYGYGAAISVILFVLTMTFSTISIFITNRKD